MFDLRYHVASLAAVFLALLIGILVGVGISGKGFVSDSERSLLNARIAELQGRLDSATHQRDDLARAQRAAQSFIQNAYPVLMANRLAGERIALVVIGSPESRARSLVEETLADGGAGPPTRVRALKVPIDPAELRAPLQRRHLAVYAGEKQLANLGRRLATDLVDGGPSPVWQVLADRLVEERSGDDADAVNGVVVVRNVSPQAGPTARFLAGFYAGLAAAGVPAVGVETMRDDPSAMATFSKARLSTVDDVDVEAGRLSLALLLA